MRIDLHVAATLALCVFCRESAGWQAPAGAARSLSRELEPKTRWCAARTALQNRNDVADDTPPPAWPSLRLSRPGVELGDAPKQVAAVAKKLSGPAEKFFIRFGSAFHYEYDLDAGSPELQSQLSIRKESSAQRVLRWLTTPAAAEDAAAEQCPHEPEIPMAKRNAVSANRKQWSTGVALAKLNARAANNEQWGIDANAAALGLGAAAPDVPRESQRIGSIGFAGMAAGSISARRDGGRRIGSIKPAGTVNDLAKPVAEARADDDAQTSSSLLGLPTPAVEIYAGGAPLDQKAAALSRAKRAAFTENLRRCAREPAINLGLGQEWDTLETGSRAK